MPIIKPEIQKVLRAVGLEKPEPEKCSIDDNLNLAGLSDGAVAEELATIALRSNNDALRLRALETALKIKGALKDSPAQIPQFTIVIQQASSETAPPVINPIVFPRQSLKGKPIQSQLEVEYTSEEEPEPDEDEEPEEEQKEPGDRKETVQ